MSLDSTARQIKQLPPTNGFLSGHHRPSAIHDWPSAVHITSGCKWRRTPRSSVYGKTRPSLLDLFGIVDMQVQDKHLKKIIWLKFAVHLVIMDL
jgi:hypothetical protein